MDDEYDVREHLRRFQGACDPPPSWAAFPGPHGHLSAAIEVPPAPETETPSSRSRRVSADAITGMYEVVEVLRAEIDILAAKLDRASSDLELATQIAEASMEVACDMRKAVKKLRDRADHHNRSMGNLFADEVRRLCEEILGRG